MKKVLVLAFFFPPLAASGSLRPAGITRHLPIHGFRPTVVAADPASVYPSAASDNSLDALISDDLEVRRIAYRNPLQQLISVRDRLRVAQATRTTSATSATSSSGDGVPSNPGLKDLILDRVFVFPDHQKYWGNAVLRWIRTLPAHEKPDVILATANPWSSLLLAQKIAKKLRVPWVADFRDPWYRNPKAQPNERLLPQVKRLEASVFASADHIIANTSALASSFREDYPQAESKISTITNGFASELMPSRSVNADGQPPELCHFGSVYPLRNPKTLLRSLSRLAAEGSGPLPRLRFVGGWDVEDAECDQLAHSLEEQGLLRREGSMTRDRAMEEMAAASHLLILQQDFPLQIPAKLYEYIATGRPIVAIGGQGATRSLIESRQLGLCCNDDPSGIEAVLKQVGANNGSVPRASETTIEEFEYRHISAQVAGVLKSSLG